METTGKLDLLKSNKPSDEVLHVYQNYLEALKYHGRNYNRCLENWRFYFGLDAELGLGQWPMSVVQSMGASRQLLTYNFIKVAVDTLAGSIMQQPFDPDFIPVNSEITSLITGIKKAMYSDKELMDWDTTFLEVVVHGLIYEAVCKIKVSDKYSELGNIGFEICTPGSVISDPYWKTWNSRDCKRAWKKTWIPVKELVELYPEAIPYVQGELAQTKHLGDRYDANTGAVPFVGANGQWGNAYEIIEEYNVLEEKSKSEWIITPNGDVEIPKMPDSNKPNWLDNHIPDWSPEHVYEKDEKRKVCVVTAICPSIGHYHALAKGKTLEQVEALPFHFWSASRHNGQSHSVVDGIKDVQKNINYWESMLTHKIQTEGGGGAQFVDPAGFKDRNEYLRYCRDANDPTARFETKEGLLIDGKSVPSKSVQNSGFPSEVYENLNHMIHTILPNISKVTPAKLGQPGQEEQMSGKLYDMMRVQSDVQAYTIHYGLRLFYNSVYESYLLQAAQTYSNEQIPRTFAIKKGRESITLNEPVTLEDGQTGIKNDVAKLKEIRLKVIISEKQASPTEKRGRVNELSLLLKEIPEDKTLTRSIIWSKVIENIDYLDEETKEMLEEADIKELELADANVFAAIETAKMNAIMAQAQSQQAVQPQEPQGGELPPEGENPENPELQTNPEQVEAV